MEVDPDYKIYDANREYKKDSDSDNEDIAGAERIKRDLKKAKTAQR